MTAGVHPNIHILIKMMAVWCYQKEAQSFLHYVVCCFDGVASVTYIQPSLYVMWTESTSPISISASRVIQTLLVSISVSLHFKVNTMGLCHTSRRIWTSNVSQCSCLNAYHCGTGLPWIFHIPWLINIMINLSQYPYNDRYICIFLYLSINDKSQQLLLGKWCERKNLSSIWLRYFLLHGVRPL